MLRALLVASLIALAGCTGLIEPKAPVTGSPPVDPVLPGVDSGTPGDGSLSDADVFARLSPTCVGCHGPGSNRPYFVSLAAFQTLLVNDRKWIVPALPAQSAILPLLKGLGLGAYAQMPVGGAPFAQLGGTKITILELEQWIAKMNPDVVPPPPAGPDLEAPIVQRKTARQILAAASTQLGLSFADLEASGFALSSPDMVGSKPGYNNGYWVTYQQLGGASWLERKRANNNLTRTFVQLWVPTSQAWCKTAVGKPGNPAIFIDATPADRSTTLAGETAIRKNIGTLFLKLLGQPATAAEVDALLTLYKAKEPTSSDDAWATVCAALLRDPLWLTY